MAKVLEHNWRRYWVSAEKDYPVDHMGFPINPVAEHAWYYQTEAAPFDKLTERRCLILLGDPGLGKTTALSEAYETAKAKVAGGPDQVMFRNLGEFESQSYLVDEVFRAPEVERWKNDGGTMHLFLDSLDEGRLHIDAIARTIESQIRKLQVERLTLRIACRSAEWPEPLTSTLKDIYKAAGVSPDSFGVFHLMPLHADDVRQAANDRGIDPDVFLKAVLAREAVAMAMRPVTLKMLLDIFQREGALPTSKWDVYEKGCLLLCEDSEERKVSGCLSKLSPQHKLDLAGHVLGHLLLTNKAFVWRGEGNTEEAEQGLPEHLLMGDLPTPDGQSFSVSPADLREVFNVGLFARRGENRLAPAHQTYAEFLTCRHLVRFGLSPEQLRGLVFGEDDHLVPQLEELTGWLVGRNPGLLEEVLQRDPHALLRGDITSEPDKVKASIVEALLRDMQQIRIESRYNWRDHRRLKHPGLADQLRQWLDPKTGFEARKLAVLIAKECEVEELSGQFACIALDDSEEYVLRQRAAMAVSELGSPEARRALLPLLSGNSVDDPHGELKGYAIRATWPDHVDSDTLFRCLMLPPKDHHFGMYYMMLLKISKTLDRKHYPSALLWVAHGFRKLTHEYDDIFRSIITGACQHLDDTDVADAFLECILRLQTDHASALDHLETSDTVMRGLDAAGLVDEYFRWLCMECSENPSRRPWYMIYVLWRGEPQFARIVRLYEAEEDERLKNVLVEFAPHMYDCNDTQQTELMLTMADRDALFASQFRWLREASVLGSPEASEAKAKHEKRERLLHRRDTLPKPHTVSAQDVVDVLAEGRETLPLWPHLAPLLSSKPGQPINRLPSESSLDKGPMWSELTQEMQGAVLLAALDFVNQAAPTGRAGERIHFYGIEALVLLSACKADFVAQLSPEKLEKWLPDIVGMPIWGSGEAEAYRRPIVLEAMANVPEQMAEQVGIHLALQALNSIGHVPEILSCFKEPWQELLVAAVVRQIDSPDSAPKYALALLRRLAEANPVDGHVVATRLFHSARERGADGTEIAAGAASVLMSHSPELDWELIWRTMLADHAFSEAFVTELAHFRQFDFNRLWGISENAVSDLYLHLYDRYPNREDPRLSGLVTPRHAAEEFKRLLLVHLENRASRAAVDALRRIQSHDPDLDWVRYHVHRAKDALRRTNWQPPTSQNLDRMLREKGRIFIQSGEHLMDVVLKQLQMIEDRLHGHTPRSPALWNEGSQCMPKPENDYSDYLKGELEDALRGKGLILNREVEIQSGSRGLGDRVDIHIDAVVPGHARDDMGRIKLIIEVKGCWHPELFTAMETQLAERYMHESDCRHGIYLVGWFDCERWDKKDRRRKAVPPMAITTARTHFVKQAAELSNEGRRIASYVMNTGLRINSPVKS